jgi:transcriptional regulator with XRE-family HTH domain
MDLNLLQREVADIIGVDTTTVFNWETQGMTPNVRTLPKVIEFLGYDPRAPGPTIGEKLRRHREGLGLSWAEAATAMGVDPATVSKWECQPDVRQNYISVPKIIDFIGYDIMPKATLESELVRQLSLLAGLTQEQLAGKLGVCQDKVSRWETGKELPSEQVCEAIMQMTSRHGRK